jgi:hypothetical protein
LYRTNATGITKTHPGTFTYFDRILTDMIIITILRAGIPPYIVVSLNGPFSKHDILKYKYKLIKQK